MNFGMVEKGIGVVTEVLSKKIGQNLFNLTKIVSKDGKTQRIIEAFVPTAEGNLCAVASKSKIYTAAGKPFNELGSSIREGSSSNYINWFTKDGKLHTSQTDIRIDGRSCRHSIENTYSNTGRLKSQAVGNTSRLGTASSTNAELTKNFFYDLDGKVVSARVQGTYADLSPVNKRVELAGIGLTQRNLQRLCI